VVFFSELNLARDHLKHAWELEPKYPEPATAMITVAMGDPRPDETPRTWFDRAIASQIDYYSAYDSYSYSLTPKWGGSDERRFNFAVECLDSGPLGYLYP